MKKSIKYFIILIFLSVTLTITHHSLLNLQTISKNKPLTFSTLIISKEFVNYYFIIGSLIVKILIITIIITIVNQLLKVKILFKDLINIVIKAEFIFLLALIAEIIYFYFFNTNFTGNEVNLFYPFSLINFFDLKKIEPWFIYPFQTINLFEFSYILYLSYMISKLSKKRFSFGLKIVASSYGSALLLWIVVVMFFTLNYS